MGLSLNDILAALAGCLDATTQAILAMTFGFAMIPSALAYAVGIGGCLAFNSVVPISFQAETITLGGTLTDPCFTLSLLLTLAVIPAGALSNRGLVDVSSGKFLDVVIQ